MLAHTVDVSAWYFDLLTSLHERGVAATLTAQRALRDSRT